MRQYLAEIRRPRDICSPIPHCRQGNKTVCIRYVISIIRGVVVFTPLDKTVVLQDRGKMRCLNMRSKKIFICKRESTNEEGRLTGFRAERRPPNKLSNNYINIARIILLGMFILFECRALPSPSEDQKGTLYVSIFIMYICYGLNARYIEVTIFRASFIT